ncbi:MAG: hypothetical protein HYY84_07600 [Deltaproteobacteria bacterium]|nr:hypothetical protein [Deltaproteobacteria bacterium]
MNCFQFVTFLAALSVAAAPVTSCKSKKPAPESPAASRRDLSRDAGASESRARAARGDSALAAPVPRAPERLADTVDAGVLSAATAHLAAQAIEKVRALESYKRLAQVPSEVDRLAHKKEWDKALLVIRSVDALGKRVKDESADVITRAGPEALDFMTKLSTFVIDARTELSMVEVDRSAEQREKSVKRFVDIGKAVFR